MSLKLVQVLVMNRFVVLVRLTDVTSDGSGVVWQ